jgi:hypothetical protein
MLCRVGTAHHGIGFCRALETVDRTNPTQRVNPAVNTLPHGEHKSQKGMLHKGIRLSSDAARPGRLPSEFDRICSADEGEGPACPLSGSFCIRPLCRRLLLGY